MSIWSNLAPFHILTTKELVINTQKQAMFKTSVIIIWLHIAYFQKIHLEQKTWRDYKEYTSWTSWEESWLNRDLEL